MVLLHTVSELRSGYLLFANGLALVAISMAADLFARRRTRVRVRALEAELTARLAKEHSHFIAATESALDAFYILESARGYDGTIVDFTFRYVNARAEQRLGHSREYLLGRHACLDLPVLRKEGLFDVYCEVVRTGVPATRDFQVNRAVDGIESVRHHVVKLGDGVAVTSSDLTDYLSVTERLAALSSLNDSIFQAAPFSIIATDGAGTITAMNAEAERLSGYSRAEMVGKQSLLALYDAEELRERSEQLTPSEFRSLLLGERNAQTDAATVATDGICRSVFDLVAVEDSSSEVEPQDWTYVRRDGTRTPVSVTIRTLRSEDGDRTATISIAQEVSRSQMEVMGSRSLRPTHDALTGLIARELLEDRIEQAIVRASRSQTLVGVYLIDLDHFKGLNDSLGHRTGDEILTLSAKRLLGMLRRSDTVARLGGDEFVVVMSELKDMATVELCGDKLVQAITAPFPIDRAGVQVAASIGVSVYPTSASNTTQLLERAETAMNAAKQAGRNRFEVFSATMLDELSSRLSMESALRGALDRDELYVEYQPQVQLPEAIVIGMEALLRWKHPQLGLVSPAHFIPMAEEMGLMPEFGAWAMMRACTEARQIQLETGRRLMVSVNLSPYQFQDGRLVERVKAALSKSGLPAEDLEIEITENTLMVNSTANLAMLQQIRALGVRLSIDDFGTGFSSFSYLLQYKVDRLKIDQSFIRQAVVDTNAASVVRTIIAMSHGLGIKVIAEGVETHEQLKFLLQRRCDEAQGYYFARPAVATQFAAVIKQSESMKVERLASGADVGAQGYVEEIDAALTRDGGQPNTSLRMI